jgi:hypothetical protein
LEPLDAAARHDLLEILEERYGRRSTVITSQLPVDRWNEIIGDPTYADAILDRLVHNAHRIELTDESMRRTRGKQNQKVIAGETKSIGQRGSRPGRHHSVTVGGIIQESRPALSRYTRAAS